MSYDVSKSSSPNATINLDKIDKKTNHFHSLELTKGVQVSKVLTFEKLLGLR